MVQTEEAPDLEETSDASTASGDRTVFRIGPRRWRWVLIRSSRWLPLAGVTCWLLPEVPVFTRNQIETAIRIGVAVWWGLVLIAVAESAAESAPRQQLVLAPPHLWILNGPEGSAADLAMLDRSRSADRTLADRLIGRQYLYFWNGDRIRLQRGAYAPADLRALLSLLGVRS